jgi:hypothetical protein
MKYGHWKHYPKKLEPDRAIGFVYLIIDNTDNSKYIGMKLFRGRGRINRGKTSNWKTYTSSSKELNSRIVEKGKDNFTFIILEQYYTLGGLRFAEIWSQTVSETPSKNNEFINRFIDKINWKVTEPVTNNHKRRLTYWIKKFPFNLSTIPSTIDCS